MPLSVTSRGDTRIESRSLSPAGVRPFGSAVHMMLRTLIAVSSGRKRLAIGCPIGGTEQILDGNLRVGELAPQRRVDRGAEEQHVHLYRDGGLTGDRAGRSEIVGEAQIELDRRADQAQHAER